MSENSSIYKQLRDVQNELKAPKNEQGRFGKSRSAEKILEAAKPVLKRHNLTLVVSDDVTMVGQRYYIRATATVFNDKGEFLKSSANAWEGEQDRGLDTAQVSGKTSSYARKYALGGLLAIDDTKDADLDDHHTKPPVKVTSAKKDPTAPTTRQLETLKQIVADLDLDDTTRGDFFQDAIGKARPTTHDDFEKSIAFGKTVLADLEDQAREALNREDDDGEK